jgi:biopolymer transport protein ExbD
MSVQIKEDSPKKSPYVTSRDNNYYSNSSTKVNLNDLVNRLKVEKKKEQKNNIILSAIAVTAVTVFGFILTL